jgi:hypothetical protein
VRARARALAAAAAAAAAPAAGPHAQAHAPHAEALHIPGCPPACSAHGKDAAGWCSAPVRVPHVDWRRVLESEPLTYRAARLAPGLERLSLPHGLVVYVVEAPEAAPAALEALAASMADGAIAIDLEWRPAFTSRQTPVAMVQLASASVCVLLRTARMSFALPPAAAEFLARPGLTLLGVGWDGSDERKMRDTFGFGRERFAAFVDLQEAGRALGYGARASLKTLAEAVLGLPLAKSKSVTMSNWEARSLSRLQLKYAALDVLVAGQVYRAMRAWHAAPAPCATCRQPLGGYVALPLGCGTCARSFHDIYALRSHCRTAQHVLAVAVCDECGRHCAKATAP